MPTEKTLIGYRVKTKQGHYVTEFGSSSVDAPRPVSDEEAYAHADLWARLHPSADCPQIIKVFKRMR
jgi:hypothetical protein